MCSLTCMSVGAMSENSAKHGEAAGSEREGGEAHSKMYFRSNA